MATATNGQPRLRDDYQMVVNEFLIRANLLRNLLDTERRDLNQECGWPADISTDQYVQMYEREGIATRVVSVWPDECWQVEPEIYETEDAEETQFEEAWAVLCKEINVLHFFHRIDELSGVGRFGILLLGFDDGEDLANPIAPGGDRKLLYLRAFDESVVQIDQRETDKKNPRFGLPTIYTVSFSDKTGPAVESISTKVHWTRVIHVADGRRSSEVLGTPRQKPVYNRLVDIRKTLGGSAEMFYKGAFPGHVFEIDKDASINGLSETDRAKLKEEFQAYSEGLQRFLAVAGMKAQTLSPQVADPTGHVELQITAICITLQIPKRVFMGSEQAQLAASQDAKTWKNRVARRQNKYLTPMLIRPFVDRMMEMGVLPEVDDYKVDWPDLYSMSDLEQAQLAVAKTDAMSKYVGGGVDQLIPVRIYLERILNMPVEVIDAIETEMKKVLAEMKAEEDAMLPPPEDGQDPNAPPPGKPGQQLPAPKSRPFIRAAKVEAEVV